MNDEHLTEEEIASLSSDEAFEKLIGMLKEMSHDEMLEFYCLIKGYIAAHDGKNPYIS